MSQSDRTDTWEAARRQAPQRRRQSRAQAELARMTKAWKPHETADLPAHLEIDHIKTAEHLFQLREGLKEHHAEDLKRRLTQDTDDLKAVLVMRVGHEAFLIDGHHRREAYLRAGRKLIPVSYFQGSPQEAMERIGLENARLKLPMTTTERLNYAWRLVLLSELSTAKTANRAGVSPRSVANMRKTKRKLDDARRDIPDSWDQARALSYSGTDRKCETDDDWDVWEDELAEKYNETLGKTFGNKLTDNPKVTALALEKHLGRRLNHVMEALGYFRPDNIAFLHTENMGADTTL
jgi:hypothetical protein